MTGGAAGGNLLGSNRRKGDTVLVYDSPTRRGAAGGLGSYVATNLYEGRTLFDVLADDWVEQRRDDYPDLLNQLAADTVVRAALLASAAPAVASPTAPPAPPMAEAA